MLKCWEIYTYFFSSVRTSLSTQIRRQYFADTTSSTQLRTDASAQLHLRSSDMVDPGTSLAIGVTVRVLFVVPDAIKAFCSPLNLNEENAVIRGLHGRLKRFDRTIDTSIDDSSVKKLVDIRDQSRKTLVTASKNYRDLIVKAENLISSGEILIKSMESDKSVTTETSVGTSQPRDPLPRVGTNIFLKNQRADWTGRLQLLRGETETKDSFLGCFQKE
ncbi:hypothetical protein DL98DRAFT_537763 [Cadophora sp. DSE1049]|nr:hypothetical protein DL98DRAFT_537763 [Cadophora sp. DSE1049]